MSGVYGYTHSSAEALQLIRYLMEGISPGPPELLPLICRSAGAVKQRPRNLSDLYLVELSSAKVISVADTILQQNYLKSHLADFFDDHDRSRKFWLFARGARREAMHNWLAREPAFLKQPEEYRKVLANVTMRTVTLDELIEDMREIVGRLLRVVFISHFNARLSVHRACESGRRDGRLSGLRPNPLDVKGRPGQGDGARQYGACALHARFRNPAL
jgi:hypothetical protein